MTNTNSANKNTIETIIEENDDVIKEYGLEKLVYSTLPPSEYKSIGVKSVEASIQLLRYDHILHEKFKNISIKSDWCKNKHTMVLIAVKGNPEKPHETFKAESIYFEHQASATHYVPNNFYDLVEKMVPGEKQYLEVFSTRQYSDSWHIMDTKPNNLTKGENKND